MKVAVVIAAFRQAEAGRLKLEEGVLVHNEFRSVVGAGRFSLDPADDSDPEPWARLGTRVALRWLAYRALVRSSNLATNLVLEAVGIKAAQAVLASLGAGNSSVVRGIEDADARAAGLQNRVTASDLARVFSALATGAAAGRQSCDEILSVLLAQRINDGLPAGLPRGTRIAHKSGWTPGISHDVGIVYPAHGPDFVIAVCTSSQLGEQAALEVIAAAAAAAWSDTLAMAGRFGGDPSRSGPHAARSQHRSHPASPVGGG
jgi:beta-lactamase class A